MQKELSMAHSLCHEGLAWKPGLMMQGCNSSYLRWEESQVDHAGPQRSVLGSCHWDKHFTTVLEAQTPALVVNFSSFMNQGQANILKLYTVYCFVKKKLSRKGITLLFILVMCPFRSS